MADFDIIEAGFDCADETINFGTRSIGYDSLYEISTLACLKSSNEERITAAIVTAQLKNGQMIVSTNHSLKVFEDVEEFNNIIFNMQFESVILNFAISECGRYIVVCLANGLVTVCDISRNNSPVYSEQLFECDDMEISRHIDTFPEPQISNRLISFIVVLFSGTVHRIIIVTDHSIEAEDEKMPVCSLEKLIDLKSTVRISTFSFPSLVTNGSKFCMYNVVTQTELSSTSLNNLKTLTPFGHYIIGLDTDGCLYRICLATLIIFHLDYDFLVEDLRTIEDQHKKQFLLWTKKDEQGNSYLQLVNTDLTRIFSLKVSNSIILIQPEQTTDDVIFISKICPENSVMELRIQRVYETQPVLRLTKLIRKQQFQEAEKFAKQFNINPLIIQKAKAELIVVKTECTSEDVVNLIRLLDAINEDVFNLQCCSGVDCGNLEDVRTILTYGVKIVPKNNDSKYLKNLLSEELFRFDTFMALSGDNDVHSWCKFLTADLIEEVKMFLKNFQIEDAIIIYNRLDRETVEKSLTNTNIEEILRILNNLPSKICQPFLSTFIPITITHRPETLSIFVKWLYNRILQLEKRDPNNFPENGISFADSILKLMRVDNSSSISFQRYRALNKEGIDELASLMEGLQTLHKLKKGYKVNIPLAEYLQGPEALVKFLLNIIMPPEDYEDFLKGFLYPYLLRNQFDPDKIFFDEIIEFIKYDDCWMYVIETLVKYISSIETKLLAVVEILEKMPVPWNDVVKKIAKNSLGYSHPLTMKIGDFLKDETRLVVLRNPKYKVKDKNVSTIEEFRRVIERIVYVNEPNFLEDCSHMCRSSIEKREANIIIFKRFILKGCLDEALTYLNKCSKDEVYECAKWHFSYIEIILNNMHIKASQKAIFYKALYPLYKKLINICDDPLEKQLIENKFHTTRAVYIINEKYGRNIKTEDIRMNSRKIDIFKEIIEEIAVSAVQNSLDITELLKISADLSVCFSMETNYVLLELCNKMSSFATTLKAAQYLYENECNSKNLCLIAVLCLKYLAAQHLGSNGESFNTSSDALSLTVDDARNVDKNETDMFVEGLILCQKIATKALLSAKEDETISVYEVVNWVNSCYYLTKRENNFQEEIYKTFYTPIDCIPSSNTFSTIRDTFSTCTTFISSLKLPQFQYVCYFDIDPTTTMSEEHLLQQFSTLRLDIDTMCKEGQHLTAFKLLKTIKSTLSLCLTDESNVIKTIDSIFMKNCLPSLIHIVLSGTYIDLSLLYNLLMTCGKDYLKYVQYYLKMYRRQPRKLRDLSVLGIKLLDFHKENHSREVMMNAVLSCKWWKKLQMGQGKMQYETFFKGNASTRLSQLINLDLIDISLLREYCMDFNIHPDGFYKEYLKSCLLNWKPDYECKTDLNGNTSIIIKNNEKELHAKVSDAITYIKDKNDVFNLLEKIINVVNFYYHEVFICIYNILKNNSEASSRIGELLILFFLKDYKRFNSPSQREKEEWYTMFPDSQILEPLSEYRLPFTQLLFTSDIWSIIRPEINLKSYKSWFDMTNVLEENLKKDDICVYAIKQVVTSGLLGDGMSKEWILYPKLDDLFKEVDECARNISDLEKATSAIYHLMNHTPNGADKVSAAQLSFKYASSYRKQHPNSSNVEKAYIKVKNKYYGFSAMHILYKFNLTDDKYLQLVSHPESLVEGLYMDERILKQAESVSLSCPDINAAVDSLSKLFQINIQMIRYNLLNSWLKNSDMDFDLDTSLVFPIGQTKNNNTLEECDANLARAIYLCNSCNSEFWTTYLITVALSEDGVEATEHSEQNSNLFKSKALKCLCAITDKETIVKLTKVSYTEFLNYVDKLTLLSQLECLGIYLNVETLDKYNKKDLLKRLSQMGKNLATKVMGAVCITYSMDENRYWEFIINNSIKLGMISDLKTYVDFLKDKCDRPFYIKAWQEIIDNSFQRLGTEDVGDIDELYVNNFLMIQSSPVLFSLDFEKVIKHCIQMKKIEFAAVLIQYLPEEKKQIYACDILKTEDLLSDLDKLDRKGIWGVRNVKKWLGNTIVC